MALTTAKTLLVALKGFPAFLLNLFAGLLLGFLQEREVFLLVVFAVLVGVATTAVIGAAVALGIYIVFYILSEYVKLANRNFALLLRVISNEQYTID